MEDFFKVSLIGPPNCEDYKLVHETLTSLINLPPGWGVLSYRKGMMDIMGEWFAEGSGRPFLVSDSSVQPNLVIFFQRKGNQQDVNTFGLLQNKGVPFYVVEVA